jgi:hypothetical protein
MRSRSILGVVGSVVCAGSLAAAERPTFSVSQLPPLLPAGVEQLPPKVPSTVSVPAFEQPLKPAAPAIVVPPSPLPPPAPVAADSTIGIFGEPVPTEPPAWGRIEYLYWTMTGGRLPPVLTTSPPGTPAGVAGLPGLATTGEVFGGDTPLDGARSGLRLSIGTWLDTSRTLGLEASAFGIDRFARSVEGGSAGTPIVGSSPFIDVATGLPGVLPVAYPGLTAGTASASIASRTIWGGDALGRALIATGPGWRIDGLAGFRYFEEGEGLDIRSSIAVPPATGFVLITHDGIRTENRFYGSVVGFDAEADYCGWTLTLRPSVAVGVMDNVVSRTGESIVNGFGGPLVAPGGNYNLLTNLGTVRARDWTVIPQCDVRVSKHVLDCLLVSVGYSAMYLPLVSRAGEQIDPVLNAIAFGTGPVTGAPRPAPILVRDSAWLHGLTIGLELRY